MKKIKCVLILACLGIFAHSAWAAEEDVVVSTGNLDFEITAPTENAHIIYNAQGNDVVAEGMVAGDLKSLAETRDDNGVVNGYSESSYGEADIKTVITEGKASYAAGITNSADLSTDFGNAEAVNLITIQITDGTKSADMNIQGWATVAKSLDGRYVRAEFENKSVPGPENIETLEPVNLGRFQCNSEDSTGKNNFIKANVSGEINSGNGIVSGKGEAFSYASSGPNHVYVTGFIRKTIKSEGK